MSWALSFLSLLSLTGAAIAAVWPDTQWLSVFFAALSAACVSGIANLYTGRLSQTQSALCEILWNDDPKESIAKGHRVAASVEVWFSNSGFPEDEEPRCTLEQLRGLIHQGATNREHVNMLVRELMKESHWWATLCSLFSPKYPQ